MWIFADFMTRGDVESEAEEHKVSSNFLAAMKRLKSGFGASSSMHIEFLYHLTARIYAHR